MDTDVVFLPPVTQPRAPPLPGASCALGPKPHASCLRPAAPPPSLGTCLLGEGPRGLPGGGCRGPPKDTRLGVRIPPATRGPSSAQGRCCHREDGKGLARRKGTLSSGTEHLGQVPRAAALPSTSPGETHTQPQAVGPCGTPSTHTLVNMGFPALHQGGSELQEAPGKVCLPIFSWIPEGS